MKLAVSSPPACFLLDGWISLNRQLLIPAGMAVCWPVLHFSFGNLALSVQPVESNP
jgi:hypothetical protein